MKSVRRSLLLALCVVLAACSGGGSNSRIDYKEAKTLPPLEVPPGLGAPVDTGTDNVPEIAGGPATGSEESRRRVLPLHDGIRVARDGSTRWLVIDSSADKLWPELRQFWGSIGLELKVDEPDLGIMETQWAENRADLPQGYFARMVRKIISTAYSADTRDKYRLRLEPVDDQHTEVFITHYGLKQVVANSQAGEVVETAWEVRPSDPELANEVLNRLVLFLGGSKKTAETVLQAKAGAATSESHIDGDVLVINESFSRAWRLTGLALDRIGLVVEDRNRSAGIYYVSHVDMVKDAGAEKKKGWLSSLFSSDSDKAEQLQKEWQIHLAGDDSTTRVRVRDAQGTPVPAKTASQILKRLQESLH